MLRRFFMLMAPEGEATGGAGGEKPVIDPNSVSMIQEMAQHQDQKKGTTTEEAGKTTQTQAEQTTQADKTTEEKPVYEGLGGPVQTVEELLAYTKKLEDDKVQSTLAQTRQVATQEQPTVTTVDQVHNQQTQAEEKDEFDYDQMYDDPKAFVNNLKESIRQEFRQESDKEKQSIAYWQGFYERFPVLKDHQKMVDMVKASNWDQLKGLPVDQAEKFIVEKSAEMINDIRKGAGQKTVDVLKPGEATTVDTTESGAGPVETPTEETSTNFAQQVKEWQSSKFDR